MGAESDDRVAPNDAQRDAIDDCLKSFEASGGIASVEARHGREVNHKWGAEADQLAVEFLYRCVPHSDEEQEAVGLEVHIYDEEGETLESQVFA